MLEFGEDYPEVNPSIHFINTLHHSGLDGMQRVSSEPLDSFNIGTITNACKVVDMFLRQPLHPCEHCTPAFYERLEMNRVRRATINSYATCCLHPALFDTTAGLQDAWLDA